MPGAISLHPIDPAILERFTFSLAGGPDSPPLIPHEPEWSEQLIDRVRRGYALALDGSEEGANAISFGFAQLLATSQPTFVATDAGLTVWEARVDRGIGMLLRPPSRLFAEAGLDSRVARKMPIRLDLNRGQMGGSYVPSRLIPELSALLESRTDRLLRRLTEAELDAVGILGQFIEAVAFAAERQIGLFEALDVITPEAPHADPPGTQVRFPDRRQFAPGLRHRLEEAAKPPKRPSLVARLTGRASRSRNA